MAVAANRSVDLNHLHPVKERNQYDPCIIVIFGGAGDLSHRKLIPALYNLFDRWRIARQVRDPRVLDGGSRRREVSRVRAERYRAVLAPPGRKRALGEVRSDAAFQSRLVHRGRRLPEPAQAMRADRRGTRHRGQSRFLLRDSAGLHRHLLGRIDRGGDDSFARQGATVHARRGRKADRIRSRERVGNQRGARAPFR